MNWGLVLIAQGIVLIAQGAVLIAQGVVLIAQGAVLIANCCLSNLNRKTVFANILEK